MSVKDNATTTLSDFYNAMTRFWYVFIKWDFATLSIDISCDEDIFKICISWKGQVCRYLVTVWWDFDLFLNNMLKLIEKTC